MLNFVRASWSFPVVPALITSNSSYAFCQLDISKIIKGYSDKLSTTREVNYS